MDPISNDQDDLVAYVFQPDDEDDVFPGDRPLKKRRTGPKDPDPPAPSTPSSNFVPLLNGVEPAAATALREHLFRTHWAHLDARITHVLRSANHATLEQVRAFVKGAGSAALDARIPTAFIITGPNIASQDLLFEQLTESLTEALPSRFVRLRSVEAGTIKATLKQIVRAVTAAPAEQKVRGPLRKAVDLDGEEDEDGEVSAGAGAGSGVKFLDYDLAALKAYLDNQAAPCEHIFIAFQDGEGFDSGLLSDLITLFHSWRGQIPFTLLFGIATSTEMLQARLLKSTCRMLHGAQFDVVQSTTILERVFRTAVAGVDVPLRVGPSLLRSFVDRQQDQVAGIQSFINSLKYTYMSHYYANPLSLLTAENLDSATVTPELLEGIKSMPSFHTYVENLISEGHYATAKSLLVDTDMLRAQIPSWNARRQAYVRQLLVATEIVCAAEKRTNAYIDVFIELMAEGITLSPQSPTMTALKRMAPETIQAVIQHLISAASASLEGILTADIASQLTTISTEIGALQESSCGLRNLNASPSKTSRSTAIAQRVQLAQDSSSLTSADHAFTQLVEKLCSVFTQLVHRAGDVAGSANSVNDDAPVNIFPATHLVMHEAWMYDNRTPYRDVFIPRPRLVFERSLTRPQDYLACSCCSGGKTGVPPATCILYQLYLQTGSLINVADLWSAFKNALGPKTDERQALSLFYRGLAELRLLGYIKASRKKADHISKVKWM
ncbi:hypothetical protein TD95_000875 [Thielaviopsis punctulata]|uniref:Uncharacterized protein n=1 Tax=Thielaviopsis punctulata TaxID=72032 RepID=A0A0F4Z8S0_9PEZI|nr:hypothetical protein TD95_000875 [Thielaviopsis punctulata]